MANLTLKQDNFCLEYIATGNATEAYRRAYPGTKMSDKALNDAAHMMFKKEKIMTRLKELREPVIKKAKISLEQHLIDLEDLREGAKQANQFGPAITAEVSRGKACGLYVETHNIVIDTLAEKVARAKERANSVG